MYQVDLIEQFYGAFSCADTEGMVSCYHPDITFEDPAFGLLRGEDAKNMWRMLVARSKGEMKITFSGIWVNEQTCEANWKAEYVFAQTGRKVVNNISTRFEFKEGKNQETYRPLQSFEIVAAGIGLERLFIRLEWVYEN